MENKKRLINIMQNEFSCYQGLANKLFQLKGARLLELQNELILTEEFQNCNVVIVDNVGFFEDKAITTYNQKTNFRGTLYLYQINSIDLINFDIRGFMEEKQAQYNSFTSFLGQGNISNDAKLDEILSTPFSTESTTIEFNANTIELKPGTILKIGNKEIVLGDSLNNFNEELKSIEETLNMTEYLEDEEITSIRNKMKAFEAKLKDKIKPKTITISSSVHNKIKKYCQDLGLKIGDWVEEILLKSITENKAYMVEERTEEEIHKELGDKYKDFLKPNKLIKVDKLLSSRNFLFKGYSEIDFKPIYDYKGTEQEFIKECERIENIEIVNNDLIDTTYKKEFMETELDFNSLVK